MYEEEVKFEKYNETVDYELLSSFLDDNIFNIEKLIGKFIQNIVLIIENNKIFFVNIGVKKKNYEKRLNKIYLENILTEAKDLIKDTNQDQKIIHILISNYIVDGINFSKFTNNIISDNLCLELKFISIPNKLTYDIEKILEKYQIKVSKYLDYSYIQIFLKIEI